MAEVRVRTHPCREGLWLTTLAAMLQAKVSMELRVNIAAKSGTYASLPLINCFAHDSAPMCSVTDPLCYSEVGCCVHICETAHVIL